jgi:hypothetical protein
VVEDVDWYHYFKSIRQQCPWSYQAYVHCEIDITEWTGTAKPLGQCQARVYVCDINDKDLELLAEQLDSADSIDEWLFSYPGYGEYATPVPVLIQQQRQRLEQLRSQLNEQGH